MTSYNTASEAITVPATEMQATLPAGSIIASKRQHLISGWKKEVIELLLRLIIIGVAVRNYRNPWHWLSVPLALDQFRRKTIGQHRLHKFAHVDKKYYLGLYTPGWNGRAFRNFIAAELNRIQPMRQKTIRFNNAYISVTKKCPLQCEHCYEWENLNHKESQTGVDLKRNIAKIQQRGVAQIHFTGGEPLLKIDLLVELMAGIGKETECWVLTSGFRLTQDTAKRLKTAGLNGVMISLDHFEPLQHNTFRGFKDSYYWVEQAVKNAIDNRLVVALSLCATREFTNRDNLMRYAELAKKLGVSFIQLLEPKAVGHYAQKEVGLTVEQIEQLEMFYLEMNYEKKYKDFPLVSYHGYYQRRQGCFASGNRSFYLDSDGDINPCPFCHAKIGNVGSDDFDKVINEMQNVGCGQFPR